MNVLQSHFPLNKPPIKDYYKDFCYVCGEENKSLKLLLVYKDSLCLLEPNNKSQPLCKISLKNVSGLVMPLSNEFLVQINVDQSEEIVLEVPTRQNLL